MLRILGFLLALCLSASAQDLTTIGVGSGGKSPSSYVGPGDVVSGATFFFSCARAYNAAYATGSNAGCNIRRASDNHTCDILITTSGVQGATANCSTPGDNGSGTFCNATTCFVTEAYDQTGNGHHVTQATSANQPGLGFTSCGGSGGSGFYGCMQITAGAGGEWLANVSGINVAQPLTTSLVVSVTGSSGDETALSCNTAGGNIQTGFAPATPVAFINATNFVTATAATSTLYAFQGVYNTTSSLIDLNGTVTGSLSAGSSSCSSSTDITLGAFNHSNSNTFTGNVGEAILYPSALNPTQYANLTSNQRTFWGF